MAGRSAAVGTPALQWGLARGRCRALRASRPAGTSAALEHVASGTGQGIARVCSAGSGRAAATGTAVPRTVIGKGAVVVGAVWCAGGANSCQVAGWGARGCGGRGGGRAELSKAAGRAKGNGDPAPRASHQTQQSCEKCQKENRCRKEQRLLRWQHCHKLGRESVAAGVKPLLGEGVGSFPSNRRGDSPSAAQQSKV